MPISLRTQEQKRLLKNISAIREYADQLNIDEEDDITLWDINQLLDDTEKRLIDYFAKHKIYTEE